jgi:hypothetical protein
MRNIQFVVSHDCDLANADLNAEPDVVVIVGRVVTAADGNFSGSAVRIWTATRNTAPSGASSAVR